MLRPPDIKRLAHRFCASLHADVVLDQRPDRGALGERRREVEIDRTYMRRRAIRDFVIPGRNPESGWHGCGWIPAIPAGMTDQWVEQPVNLVRFRARWTPE